MCATVEQMSVPYAPCFARICANGRGHLHRCSVIYRILQIDAWSNPVPFLVRIHGECLGGECLGG